MATTALDEFNRVFGLGLGQLGGMPGQQRSQSQSDYYNQVLRQQMERQALSGFGMNRPQMPQAKTPAKWTVRQELQAAVNKWLDGVLA